MTSLHVETLREGSGRPIVLLHGWMGSHHDFDALVSSDDFDVGGRPVYAVDLPAHGASEDFDGEWGFEEATGAVLLAISDVFDPTAGEPIDLVGYSMGGRLALYLAATRSHRVHRMVLIGAHPGLEHPQDRRDRLKVDDSRAMALVEAPGDFLAEWGELELFGPRESDAWEAVSARRLEKADEHAWGWSRALTSITLARQPVLWMAPMAADVPTLYVVGSRDEKYDAFAEVFKEINSGLVDVALIVNAHHAPHLDRPRAVAKRISRFL